MTDTKMLLLATHSGTFHADDALAYAALRLALGLAEQGIDHRLVRTRDQKTVDSADIVWDVGMAYDHGRRRYDHHQRGAPVREDGTPLSSAGLVWRHHGEAAVRAILSPLGHGDLAPAVAAAVDAEVVVLVDRIDNGIVGAPDPLSLACAVDDHNLPWDSPGFGIAQAEDAAFAAASAVAEGFLRQRVLAVRARLSAVDGVRAAAARSADPRVLELDRKLPWQDAAFELGLPVLYAVYPVPNGNWMVDAMPPEPGSFAQRLPLPAAWAGLSDADLAQASGVPDAVFVHAGRFVGSARSREGAMRMAALAIGKGAG